MNCKNIFISLLLLSIFSTQLFSQRFRKLTWLDLSAKIAYGNSVLVNSNTMHDKNISTDYFTRSLAFGGRLGVNFTEEWCLSSEIMSHRFGQNYGIDNGGPANNIDYAKEVRISAIDAGLIGKYTFENIVYVEFGFKYSFINSVATQNIFEIGSEIDSLAHPNLKFADLTKKEYSPHLLSAVAGVGLIIISLDKDRFRVNLGTRFCYSFKNIMKKQELSPLKDGIYNLNKEYEEKYTEELNTKLFTGQITLEVNYFFGYYGKASCGKKRLVLFK